MARLIDGEKIKAAQRIIKKFHAKIIFRVIGPEALTEEELALVPKGTRHIDSQEKAYKYGRTLARGETKESQTLKTTSQKFEAKLPESAESSSLSLKTESTSWFRKLGEKVSAQFISIVSDADRRWRSKMLSTVGDTLKDSIERKKSIGEITTALGQNVGEWTKDWERIAVTEKVRAMNQGVADQYREEFGDPFVFIRPAPTACPQCKAKYLGPDGFPRIFELSKLEANGSNVGRKQKEWEAVVPPMHPHCHPPGTLVVTTRGHIPIESVNPGDFVLSSDGLTHRVTSAWASEYDGRLLKIQTDGGKLVSVTPNHPLEKPQGWVRGEELHVGDDLVCVHSDVKPLLFTELEALNVPTLRREEGCFIIVSTFLLPSGVPIAAIHFNGELYFWERQIDVVLVNGETWLGVNPSFDQSLIQKPFVGGVEFSGSAIRAGDEQFIRLLGSTNGSVGLLDAGLESRRIGGIHCFRPAPLLETGFLYDSHNDVSRNAKSISDFLDREQVIEMHPKDSVGGEIKSFTHSERIVRIETTKYKGKVYNLTVEGSESYVANGVSSHNCGCVLSRIPPGWGFDEEGDIVPGGEFGKLQKGANRGKLQKAGPFVGPRGGKWEDAKHTIPWKGDAERSGKGRLGLPEISEASVRAVVDKLLRDLEPSSDGIFSVKDAVGRKLVADLGGRRTKVVVKLNEDDDYAGKLWTKPSEPNKAILEVFVPKNLPSSKSFAEQELRRIIAHEATHAADPADKQGKEMKVVDPEKDYNKYINQPAEIAAHMREVYRDLHDIQAVKDSGKGKDIASWAEANSITWASLSNQLNERNRKKALKLIAGWWENQQKGTHETILKGVPTEFVGSSHPDGATNTHLGTSSPLSWFTDLFEHHQAPIVNKDFSDWAMDSERKKPIYNATPETYTDLVTFETTPTTHAAELGKIAAESEKKFRGGVKDRWDQLVKQAKKLREGSEPLYRNPDAVRSKTKFIIRKDPK